MTLTRNHTLPPPATRPAWHDRANTCGHPHRVWHRFLQGFYYNYLIWFVAFFSKIRKWKRNGQHSCGKSGSVNIVNLYDFVSHVKKGWIPKFHGCRECTQWLITKPASLSSRRSAATSNNDVVWSSWRQQWKMIGSWVGSYNDDDPTKQATNEEDGNPLRALKDWKAIPS